MQATLTLTFDPPLEAAGETYASIELTEPNAGHLADADAATGYAQDVLIIGLVTGLPKSAVRRIPARKFLKATQFLAGFMKPDPTTGAPA